MKWKKQFDKSFFGKYLKSIIVSYPEDTINASDKVKEIISFLLKSQKKEILKEHIKLSDEIEAGRDTTFDEWRAFKNI